MPEETQSEENKGGAESEKLMPNQQDLSINSNTNVFSIVKEPSRSRTKTLKLAKSVKDEALRINSNTNSNTISEKKKQIKLPLDSTDRVKSSFELLKLSL